VVRKVLFASLPTFLILGLFAIGFVGEPENDPWLNSSPLWGPGDPFYAEDPRKRNHLADPVLIWRGRPGYRGEQVSTATGVVNPVHNNAYGFRDAEVADPKPVNVTRILDIGDSATWGLNLASAEDSYSAQLGRLLDSGGGSWEVVNAGTVGYSSFQGAQLLRRWLRELDPDVVTVYLGNNDPAPGGLKDADRVAASGGVLRRWLRRNRFYLLLEKALLHLRAAGLESDRSTLLAHVSANDSEALRDREAWYRLAARVTPEQYEQNLRDVIRLSREVGARTILLRVPLNPVWPLKVRPEARLVLRPTDFWGAVRIEPGYLPRVRAGETVCSNSLAGHPYLCRVVPADLVGLPNLETLERRATDPAAPEAERVRDAHNAAIHLLAGGDTAEALARIEAALAAADACGCVLPRQRAWMLHNRGAARLQLGRGDAAFESFAQARATWPFAMNPDYDERFLRVVEELQVDWIDLPALFAAADPRFGGSALIHDWVHPNERGNALIARALAEKLREAP